MDVGQISLRQLILGLLGLVLLLGPSALAQDVTLDEVTVEPERITVEAPDGLMLVGDWYSADASRPTVLLLHQLYTDRHSWDEVAATLHALDFNVLVVDERGAGETYGAINWQKAVADIDIWVNWLRETAEVRADGLSMMGSSMGSSLAIIGCAQTTGCRTAVALSPGWDYHGLSLEETIAARPVLAIYTERDRWPVLGIPDMREAAPTTLREIVLAGNAHGMNMLNADFETLMPDIVNWLAVQSG